jgi:hypothetical protein
MNQNVGINDKQLPGWRSKRAQWRRPAEKILFTEDLEMLPLHYAGSSWGYASALTRRHGRAISHRTGAVMGVNVSAVFMDGHVQAIDEDFSKDVGQILLDG